MLAETRDQSRTTEQRWVVYEVANPRVEAGVVKRGSLVRGHAKGELTKVLIARYAVPSGFLCETGSDGPVAFACVALSQPVTKVRVPVNEVFKGTKSVW